MGQGRGGCAASCNSRNDSGRETFVGPWLWPCSLGDYALRDAKLTAEASTHLPADVVHAGELLWVPVLLLRDVPPIPEFGCCAGVQSLESIFRRMEPGEPNELTTKKDLQLGNLHTVLLALRCVWAFWTLKRTVLEASATNGAGLLDPDALYAAVATFKQGHPELWRAVRGLGNNMPGLLSSLEMAVVRQVNLV